MNPQTTCLSKDPETCRTTPYAQIIWATSFKIWSKVLSMKLVGFGFQTWILASESEALILKRNKKALPFKQIKGFENPLIDFWSPKIKIHSSGPQIVPPILNMTCGPYKAPGGCTHPFDPSRSESGRRRITTGDCSLNPKP